MSSNHARRRLLTVAAVTATAVLTLTACSGNPVTGDDGDDASPAAAENEEAADPVKLTPNVRDGAKGVKVDKVVEVSAAGGSIDKVSMFAGTDAPKNQVEGELNGNETAWQASGSLEPGKTYKVVMQGQNADGDAVTERSSFTTQALTLDQQTYASIAPLDGATVGVAMPIIVTFDIPVQDKASIERKLEVESEPKVEGTWSWISDTEVHFRPKEYWPAGSKVTVNANVNSVKAGPNLWGQEDNSATFTVGDAVESVVNVSGHKMTVKVNGKVARTLPITTGKAGFETRAGTKVIMEKYDVKRMDAATTGISEDDPEYYDIPDVQYAMRVTYTGEFIHAAPWSVGSQGAANVSHGCTGLSTADALWYYNRSNIGDPVKFINSPRTLEDGNGWTDWDESYQEFKQGSALS
ncbi:L,D-transpeptidase [Solicola gregarius]|uniref:Ig-like domain-containing protein n=1 Tax=Solicola gregarius TaxID=2908642 RepID=A0AA46YK71_9ACTN|nr:Ig-like domain-containing protein [Solicola gregarius]UYM05415.1 Ig-like domain-containing protein [Solicola gregarius]